MEQKKYKFCKQCPACKVLPDPDPYDWFCEDDVKMVCSLKLNEDKEPKTIDVSLRPYQVSKVKVPNWCPINKKIK